MKRVLVTGGGGFVGKAIVAEAIKYGVECIVIGRRRYPEVEDMGAICFQADIRDRDSLDEPMRGVDTVFHVAALAGIWGSWEEYYSINVQGTENVLDACRVNSIHSMVYTSTPSVVFNRNDIENGDESLPYPEQFLCNYAKSKVMAEKMVLSANGNELRTCAIRPHLIWGPGDPHLIPRLLQKCRNGELKKVGNCDNQVDISYIDNVAHAHWLAASNLETTGSAAGKPYFVSQAEPVNLWQWIDGLLERLEMNPVPGKVPFPVAYYAGAILEVVHTLFKREQEPRMTRFLAEQLAKSHYFSTSAIENDLGYSPVVSTEEGMNRLVDWLRENEEIYN